nr:effector binding domain-containing protein [Lysinibacillus timonensis]
MNLYIINSIRTNNFNDEQMMGKIKSLWEEASRKLVNYQEAVYGVYYDYDSNYKGDYSLSVAIEENNSASIIYLSNDTKYEVFNVDHTDEQGIIKTWGQIWELEESGLLERAYSYDFEKYYPNGEIEIHIATK